MSKFTTILLFCFIPWDCESFIHPNHNRVHQLKASILNEKDDDYEWEKLKGKNSALPIVGNDTLEQICNSLEGKHNLILESPPGAGKTTMVPLAILLKSPYHKRHEDFRTGRPHLILVVEPRRVATRSAAHRMKDLLHETAISTKASPASKLSDDFGRVGYAIRAESRQSNRTEILVVTDGVLLNMLREDPQLDGVGTIILDEFHERSVGMDTLLALSRQTQQLWNPNLRIIVMSATLLLGGGNSHDEAVGSKLLKILGGNKECDVIRTEGRQYPVEIRWSVQGGNRVQQPLGALLANRDLLTQIMCYAVEEALRSTTGDILAFLPGVTEINRVIRELNDRQLGVDVLPLHGALARDKQDLVVFPRSNSPRRVIVTSPIAEASLTLERVSCVVDSGLRREPRCDLATGMPRLATCRISRASAKQRAGRAGRVQQGVCIRIYSEAEHDEKFLEYSLPEIMSADLSPTALLLAEWGCSSVREIREELPFVDPPSIECLEKAIQLLVDLNALELNGDRFRTTPLGRRISKIPMHPRLATAIVKAEKKRLGYAVAAAFALDEDSNARGVAGPNLVPRVRDLLNGENTKMLLQYARRISQEAYQAINACYDEDSSTTDISSVLGEALLPGFIDLVAQRKGEASYGGSSYMLANGRTVRLDGVRDECDFAVVVDSTTGDDGIARIRAFAAISKEALLGVAVERETVYTVPTRGHEVRACRVLALGNLTLSSLPLQRPPADVVTSVLKEVIRSLGGVYAALVKPYPKEKACKVDELRARVQLAHSLCEETDWPPCFRALKAQETGVGSLADERVLDALVEPWLAEARSLKDIDVFGILEGSLTQSQRFILESCFPTEVMAADGSIIPIIYSVGQPSMSAKLQQCFGMIESPRLGPLNRRIPVAITLLSPAGKPLAQTIDLLYFWKEVYPSVRAEMRGRYPKHPWPEDPINAIPTSRTSKQQAAITSAIQDNEKSSNQRNSKRKTGKKR